VLRFNVSDTQMTRTVRFSILVLTAILLLVLGSPPLESQEQEGDQVAIGFIHPDGQTGLSYFKAEGHEQPEPIYGMVSAVPSEPPGHRLVYLTNLERVSRGVAPLKAAPELMAAAQFHSNWMASNNCFDHTCPGEPGWVARIVNAGYLNYELLGENIAGGQSTASAAVSAWMGSAGHRANMLNPGFREAGGGYAYSASATYHHYWTMDFGARRDDQGDPVYPLVINNEAWSTTSAQVELYLHGGGWANQMRFRNENGAWSPWEPFSAEKLWTLPPPLSVQPQLLVFLSEQGTAPTFPAYYDLTVDPCTGNSPATVYAQIRQGTAIVESRDEIYVSDHCETWGASADHDWVLLDPPGGSELTTVRVSLDKFPTDSGPHTATITVETAQKQISVQVTLVVTDGPLVHSYVPLATR
jgi:hypothetical protein